MEELSKEDLNFNIPESQLHIQNLINSIQNRANLGTVLEFQCRILSKLEGVDIEKLKDEAFALRKEKFNSLMNDTIKGFNESANGKAE